jgi:tyrosine-protein phosphatase YwqE
MTPLFNRKQTLANAGFFQGFTDRHCHILPGVDDGMQTEDEALRVLTAYETLGITAVVFTPHMMQGTGNTTDSLTARFKKFSQRYTGSITLSLGAEYMLEKGFETRLESDHLLPIADGRLLVETSYFSPPNRFDEMLYAISMNGYTPVLAHPERYLYLERMGYRRLKDKEYLFQLNLPSLTGQYGERVRRRAFRLLEANMYDMMGTDLHRLELFERHLPEMKLSTEHLRMLEKLKP